MDKIIEEFFEAKALAQGQEVADATTFKELPNGLFEISFPVKNNKLWISTDLTGEMIQIMTRDLLRMATRSEKYK